MDKDILFTLLERPIAYFPAFARIGGGVVAGVFLSQCFYWTGKGQEGDGWFYKTAEEWREETLLSRRELEGARKALKEIGVLEEKLQGIPAKLHYRVNVERLLELITTVQTSLHETSKLDCWKPANKIARNEQTNTETTQRLRHTPNGVTRTEEPTLDLVPPEPPKPRPGINIRAAIEARLETEGKLHPTPTKKPAAPEDRLAALTNGPTLRPRPNPAKWFAQRYARALGKLPLIENWPVAQKRLGALIDSVGEEDAEARLMRFLGDSNRAQYGYGWQEFIRNFERYAFDLKPVQTKRNGSVGVTGTTEILNQLDAAGFWDEK